MSLLTANVRRLRSTDATGTGLGTWLAVALVLGLSFAACSKSAGDRPAGERPAGGRSGAHRGGGRPAAGGFPGGGFPGGAPVEAGVPVEVETATRAPIALYFESNGTLEAERDVDLVARAAGPIVELRAEEGLRVEKGQLLARIDDSELRSQLAVAEVQLEEARAVRERTRSLWDNQLVSREELEGTNAAYKTALGDVERARIQLEYTSITAPFSGQIVRRYVRFAEFVPANAPLFRISNFHPLLCPIQVPERELSRLQVGQPTLIEVEAWPDRRFPAKVLRISPVIDAESGTVRVTLEVQGKGVLRPGMFASVFLELEKRSSALVVSKRALALDSLGDAVYVVEDGLARRRAVRLGFKSADRLEITEGLRDGEQVVVVGQDGLADSTPVEVVRRDGERLAGAEAPGARLPQAAAAGRTMAGLSEHQASVATSQRAAVGADAPGADAAGGRPREGGPAPGGPGARGRPGGGRGGFPLDLDDPAAVERAKAFMRQRGLSDEQIDERLERMRERQQGRAGAGRP